MREGGRDANWRRVKEEKGRGREFQIQQPTLAKCFKGKSTKAPVEVQKVLLSTADLGGLKEEKRRL